MHVIGSTKGNFVYNFCNADGDEECFVHLQCTFCNIRIAKYREQGVDKIFQIEIWNNCIIK